MSKSSAKESKTCQCRPYHDKFLISSQLCGFLGFVLSFCLPWTFLFDNHGLKVILFLVGFTAFLLLQLAWCCKLSKGALGAAGVLATLSGILDFIGAIPYATSTKYCDNGGDEDSCSYSVTIALVTAVFWFGCGTCVFVFTSKLRSDKIAAVTQPEIDDSGVVVTNSVPNRLPVEFVENLEMA